MVMAKYINGPRRSVQGTPSANVNAGDVLPFGNLTVISDIDNPVGVGLNITQQAFYIGGLYQVAADAAYIVGTWVWWRSDKQQVSAIYVPGVSYPFGFISAGPLGLVSDGGPTGAGSLCYVDHQPEGAAVLVEPPELPPAFPRNLIDGGDFNVNPWQRGTSFTAIANTLTYTADRWFVVGGGASDSISVSQTADTAVPGFANDMKVQRASGNTHTDTITFGQVLETLDCVRLQGQPVTLSFYAKVGANYSGGALTIQLNHSTTAGNDSAAHLVAASTNWQATPTIINTTQALTTSKVRYEVTGAIVVPTGATQLGLLFAWTPTGTAGTDDSVSIDGVQLEPGNGASAFEHRDAEMELALCQRFFYQINEPASTVVVGPGMITAAAVQEYILPMPTQMIKAPTVTVSVGTFKVNLAGTATTPTTFAAGTTHTPNYITVTSANTGQTAGQATLLQGGGGSGYIQASADL